MGAANKITMTYREPLPEDCPPDEAEEILEPTVVFRLVRNDPPTDDDFRSQRAEKPTRQFSIPECRVRGLSVFKNRSVAEKMSTTRNLRGTVICQVTLTIGAGRIQRTGSRSHYTWWPLADFDILSNCVVLP